MKSSGVGVVILLLGSFQATLDGEILEGFRSAKVRALLAYLAVESHRSWSRQVLADLFWPDLPEDKAQSNLRNAISNLRKVICDQQSVPPNLLVSQDTLQYNQKASTWLDVQVFLDLISSVGKADKHTLETDELTKLEQALELYRGDFLEGFSIDSAPFEEWVLLTSQQLQRRAVEAYDLLVQGYVALAMPERALHYARRWVKLDPLDEKANHHLIRILGTMGRRNEALVQYEAYKQRLSDDLGVKPSPETNELHEQIQSGKLAFRLQKPESLPTYQEGQLPDFLKISQESHTGDAFFVARHEELDRLNDELMQVIRGQGGIVFITGDPGSGKSALMAEFVCRAMNKIQDLIVVQSQCNAYTGEADPYFPFLEIIQTLCGDLEARVLGGALAPEHAIRLWRFLPRVVNTILEEGHDLINRFISARDLLAIVQAIQGIKPELISHLRSQVAGEVQRPVRSRTQQVALLDRYSEVLYHLSKLQPIVLILDDLQWIDTDSANLLFHIGRRLSGSHILILGAYRPEEVAMGRQGNRHPLEGVVHELQMIHGDIHIDLMQSEAADFVESLLDREPNTFSTAFRQLLQRHTAGHPLFTIELLRGMQLRGDLYRDDQRQWVEGKHLNWEALPARVEAVIAERIRHLHPDQQELLSVASVEGEQFTAEVLAEIMGVNKQEVIQILSQEIGKRHRLILAQSRGRIRGQARSQYRFRHILFQKYLYQQLDKVEKIHLHEKTAFALEAFYLQALVDYPEINHQLARHFKLAGMLEKAAQYYVDSGKYAIQLGANREAVKHYKQALQIVKSMPESEARDRQALSLCLSLGPLLTATQGWAAPELETNYQQAEDLCHKMGDDAQLVPALWLLAVYRLGRADHAAVDRLVDRLYNLAKKIGDPDIMCLADLQVSPLYQGRLDEAQESLTHSSLPRNIDQQRSLAHRFGMSPSAVSLAYLANCLWLMGFPGKAAIRIQEACDLAAEIDVPMTRCYVISRLIWLLTLEGEFEDIPNQSRNLLQISQQHELRNFELAANFFIQFLKNQAGDFSIDILDKMYTAMEEYKSLGTLLNRTAFLIQYAQACANAGLIDRGMAALDESIKLGEKTGERWFEAEAYRLKGELLSELIMDSPQQDEQINLAENSFQMALQIARQQGARMLELRATTSLGHFWQKMGRVKEARQILVDILSQFSERGNGLEIRKAEELLLDLNSRRE